MLELNDKKNKYEGETKLSDCEEHFHVLWLSTSGQASLYIGDKDYQQKDCFDFLSGEKECFIDLISLEQYLKSISKIVKKYSSMFYGPVNIIDDVYYYFSKFKANEAKIIISYVKNDRYIRILNNKSNFKKNKELYGEEPLINGNMFRNSLVGAISIITLWKEDQKYKINIKLSDEWRDKIMEENGKKVNLESLVKIFNNEMISNTSNGLTEENAARIFGIKFAPLLEVNSSKFNYEEIVNSSNFNSKEIKEAVKCGMQISPSIIWEKSIFDNNEQDDLSNVLIAKRKVSSNPQRVGENRIYYGAPGCGKSFHVKEKLDKADVPDSNRIRVTFHPEYTNYDFVGQVLPTIKDENGRREVEYIFNPGPFTIALETALTTDGPVYLIIEEINRGNAAAIFGDLFQLLDRQKEFDSNGNENPLFAESEYDISNPNIEKYLKDHIELPSNYKLKLPCNLSIYATMNTSDQNVFTLDTAFKRRWEFEQIPNKITSHDSNCNYSDYYIPGTDVTWEQFLNKLNPEILDYRVKNHTSEDKQLGKFFIGKKYLTEQPMKITDPGVSEIAEQFAYKVLEYLWNDVCKIDKDEWFDTNTNKTLEQLIEHFSKPEGNNSPLAVFKKPKF